MIESLSVKNTWNVFFQQKLSDINFFVYQSEQYSILTSIKSWLPDTGFACYWGSFEELSKVQRWIADGRKPKGCCWGI